ncbi:MAG: M1 family metallopeptidase [Clostridiales bacterium]|jgi:hypothetical protein|nr:M1 family metallopeptidase [Clostridiales bacterium]
MKQKIGKRTAAFLCLILAVSAFAGCGGGEFDKMAEGLSTYKIEAALDRDNMRVTAKMDVKYVNGGQSILNGVSFHLYPNAYREGARFSPVNAEDWDDAYPNGVSYGGISVSNLTVNGMAAEVNVTGEDENILSVALTKPLYPTDSVNIGMEFTVTLPNMRHRLGHYEGAVNLGNWYPIACVSGENGFYTDPYYDRGDPFFSEVANYDVTLTVPKDMTAALSGVTTRSETGGTAVYHSTERAIRDFAAIAGAFKTLATQAAGIDVEYYYQKDAAPEVSLMAAVDAVKTFSDLFGAYPYKSYKAAETHFLQGGMEYPTLVFISDVLDRETFTEAIVHETAHQWWYGVVGNNQIDHAWMDEGLAEYSTTMFYERNPDYNVDAQKRIATTLASYVVYYEKTANRGRDSSMTRRVNEYYNQFEYALLTYKKGELMFESIRMNIGSENFLNGLKAYYKDMSYKIAAPDDLIGRMETASKKTVKPLFDSWLDGNVQLFGGVI